MVTGDGTRTPVSCIKMGLPIYLPCCIIIQYEHYSEGEWASFKYKKNTKNVTQLHALELVSSNVKYWRKVSSGVTDERLGLDVLVSFSVSWENSQTSAVVIRERGAGLNLSACRESGRRELMTNYTQLPANLPGAWLLSSERDVVHWLLWNHRLSALCGDICHPSMP